MHVCVRSRGIACIQACVLRIMGHMAGLVSDNPFTLSESIFGF